MCDSDDQDICNECILAAVGLCTLSLISQSKTVKEINPDDYYIPVRLRLDNVPANGLAYRRLSELMQLLNRTNHGLTLDF